MMSKDLVNEWWREEAAFQEAKQFLIGVKVQWENKFGPDEVGIVYGAHIQPPIKKGERGCDHDIPPKVLLHVNFPGRYSRCLQIQNCKPVDTLLEDTIYNKFAPERIE